MKLYEALQQLDKYDADMLCRQLGKTKADLANEKSYLEQVLMKTLRQAAEQSGKPALLKEMADIMVLRDKNLCEAALERIPQAKLLATRLNEHTLLANLQLQESDLIMQLGRGMDRDATLIKKSAVMDSVSDTLRLAQIFVDFDRLGMDIFIWMRASANRPRAEVRKGASIFLKNPIFRKKYEPGTLEYIRLSYLSNIYCNMRDWDNELITRSALVKLMEANPVGMNTNENGYFLAINNLLGTYLNVENYKELSRLMLRLKQKYYTKLHFNAQKLEALFITTVELYKRNPLIRQAHAGLITVTAIKIELGKNLLIPEGLREQIMPIAWIAILHYQAVLYYITDQLSPALVHLDRVMNETDSRINPLVQCKVRVLRIMIHQQLGNYSIIPSLVRSARRFCKINKILSVIEDGVFACLLELSRDHSKAKSAAAFKKLKSSISLWEEAYSPNYLDVIELWVDKNLKALAR